MDEGVALISAAHPWYKRAWRWFRLLRLSPNSLETTGISIKEPHVSLLWNGTPDMQRRQEYYNRKWANIYAQRKTMNDDNEIEKEIQAKGLTAPRVALAHVEGCIAYEYYATGDVAFKETTCVIGPAYVAMEHADITALRSVTLCLLYLKNGFVVIGDSRPVSSENFNAELGRKVARQNAVSKVWMLEGYMLKESLYEEGKLGLTREQIDANMTAESDDPLGRPKTV